MPHLLRYVYTFCRYAYVRFALRSPFRSAFLDRSLPHHVADFVLRTRLPHYLPAVLIAFAVTSSFRLPFCPAHAPRLPALTPSPIHYLPDLPVVATDSGFCYHWIFYCYPPWFACWFYRAPLLVTVLVLYCHRSSLPPLTHLRLLRFLFCSSLSPHAAIYYTTDRSVLHRACLLWFFACHIFTLTTWFAVTCTWFLPHGSSPWFTVLHTASGYIHGSSATSTRFYAPSHTLRLPHITRSTVYGLPHNNRTACAWLCGCRSCRTLLRACTMVCTYWFKRTAHTLRTFGSCLSFTRSYARFAAATPGSFILLRTWRTFRVTPGSHGSVTPHWLHTALPSRTPRSLPYGFLRFCLPIHSSASRNAPRAFAGSLVLCLTVYRNTLPQFYRHYRLLTAWFYTSRAGSSCTPGCCTFCHLRVSAAGSKHTRRNARCARAVYRTRLRTAVAVFAAPRGSRSFAAAVPHAHTVRRGTLPSPAFAHAPALHLPAGSAAYADSLRRLRSRTAFALCGSATAARVLPATVAALLRSPPDGSWFYVLRLQFYTTTITGSGSWLVSRWIRVCCGSGSARSRTFSAGCAGSATRTHLFTTTGSMPLLPTPHIVTDDDDTIHSIHDTYDDLIFTTYIVIRYSMMMMIFIPVFDTYCPDTVFIDILMLYLFVLIFDTFDDT